MIKQFKQTNEEYGYNGFSIMFSKTIFVSKLIKLNNGFLVRHNNKTHVLLKNNMQLDDSSLFVIYIEFNTYSVLRRATCVDILNMDKNGILEAT